jgi:hypothetical protein
VSTTALRILELVKSLPPSERRIVAAAVERVNSEGIAEAGDGQSSFKPEDYQGLDDDDSFFKIIDQIEQERHDRVGPSAPELD